MKIRASSDRGKKTHGASRGGGGTVVVRIVPLTRLKRSAFTQERKTVRLRSVARYIYIASRESTLAHNISFERSSYGEPQQDQIPPKAPFNELL